MKPAHLILILSLLVATMIFTSPQSVSAAPQTEITFDQPTLNFPDSITFRATVESNTPIKSVVLEYGTDELTCGTVVAKAFPQFTPGRTVNAEWTWEMKQSGSLPPGTTIWWRWHYTDESGGEYVSEQKTLIWLDSKHNWQTAASGPINLHWYSGDQAFAKDLLGAAENGLERLQNDAGLQPDKPIHIYIYANTDDMKDAILYEPSWTGGMAFPEHDIVIIGISQRDLNWGRTSIAHELTHVLVGHLTFSCLGSVPTWLNEGLADTVKVGWIRPLNPNSTRPSAATNCSACVRSAAGFLKCPAGPIYPHSQSHSIVKYLIDTYGQEAMNSLLISLRDGTTIEDALLRIYGVDVEGLESPGEARSGLRPSLPPRNRPYNQPRLLSLPMCPSPEQGRWLLQLPLPSRPHQSAESPPERTSGPPLSLTLMLAAVCCVMFLLFAVLGLGIYFAAQKRKGGDNETRA